MTLLSLTEEDEQTHADGQDGAGAEGGQPVTFDLPQLAALTPEPLLTPAPVAVGRQRLADAAVTAGRRSAGRWHTALLTRVICHRHLAAGAPGRRQRGVEGVKSLGSKAAEGLSRYGWVQSLTCTGVSSTGRCSAAGCGRVGCCRRRWSTPR